MPGTTPSAAAWLRRYVATNHRQPGTYSMQAYTAVRVAADAVQRAGSTDHATVRAALATSDFPSPFGSVRFDARGVNSATGFQLVRIVGNAFRPVCPPSC
jgi:ABC-type branched-subunit amino acid transport system substrate-binding protein